MLKADCFDKRAEIMLAGDVQHKASSVFDDGA